MNFGKKLPDTVRRLSGASSRRESSDLSEDGDDDDSCITSTLDIHACFDTLSSLLKGGGEQKLKEKHLDAIRQLEKLESQIKSTISSSGAIYHSTPVNSSDPQQMDSQRPKLNRGGFSSRLGAGGKRLGFRRRMRGTRLKQRKESMMLGMEESKDDEDFSHVIRDVLDAYGGAQLRRAFENGVRPIQPLTGLTTSQQGSGRKAFLFKKNHRVSDRRDLLKLQNAKSRHDLFMSQNKDGNFSARLSNFCSKESDIFDYYPKEWSKLTPCVQGKLANLLSWENLSKWDFNVVEVAELTEDPLLFVGWAILCAPMAQDAMLSFLDTFGTCNTKQGSGESKAYHYDFDNLKIDPRAVCNFLREVERRYEPTSYHNNIHAADVTQSLHCLFQLMDEKSLACICNPIAIFSLLLAATFHDVGHPGTNNLFQQNAITEFAIQYNDVSILENMHSAVGHSLLMGEEKNPLWDIFEEWSKEDRIHARCIMVSSIMGTDMSGHFAKLEKLDSLIEQVEDDVDTDRPILSILAEHLSDINSPKNDTGEEEEKSKIKEDCSELADKFIKFLLHAADISNPAKVEDTALYWTDCALTEFFDQGDKEKAMNLPVSPLCDRSTTTKPDSQIGFIKFIVIPTFELLGEMIPRVKEEIMPILMNNLEYWNKEKSKGSCLLSVAEEE